MNSATLLQSFKLNPFTAQSHNQPPSHSAPLEEPVGLPPAPPEPAPSQVTARFIKLIGIAAALFVVLLFSVFREIAHNRELYRMSQMVAASDAREREWQERYRLIAAQIAMLEAQLQSQPAPDRTIQIIKTTGRLPD